MSSRNLRFVEKPLISNDEAVLIHVNSSNVYPYIGKLTASKLVDFTGVGIVLHVFTDKSQYLFSAVSFANGFKFQQIDFDSIFNEDRSIFSDMINSACSKIITDKQRYNAFGQVIADFLSKSVDDTITFKYVVDYYVYNHDNLIGAYRFVDVENEIQLGEILQKFDTQIEKIYSLVLPTENLQYVCFCNDNIKRFSDSFSYKSDLSGLKYEFRCSDNVLICKAILEISNDVYFSSYETLSCLPKFKLQNVYAASELKLTVNRVDDKYVLLPITRVYNSAYSLIQEACVYMFAGLSHDSEVITLGGSVPYKHSNISSKYRKLVPLSKSDMLVDVDNSLAVSKYDEFINKYQLYGLDLYGRLYMSNDLLVLGIRNDKGLLHISGFSACQYSDIIDDYELDKIAFMHNIKSFSGILIKNEDRNVDLSIIDLLPNDVIISFTPFAYSYSTPYANLYVQFLGHAIYKLGYDLAYTQLPECFQPKKLYITHSLAYLSSFDLSNNKTVTLEQPMISYTSVPLTLFLLADQDFAPNFLVNGLEKVDSYENFLLSITVSSNSFDVSNANNSLSCIPAFGKSKVPSLRDLYCSKYNHDDHLIQSFKVKRLLLDRQFVLSQLNSLRC